MKVVAIAAVCYTMISRAPVVFLAQAEADNGQIDVMMTPLRMSSRYYESASRLLLILFFSAFA